MTRELAVWLFDKRAGTLTFDKGRLGFSYEVGYLSQANAVPLSASLPLQAEPFEDSKTRPFFAGLLPEGRMRDLIARELQVSQRNDFALLDHIGGECAGAVTFLALNQTLPQSEKIDVEWLSDQRLVEILSQLPGRPMLAGEEGLRLSLAGAQDKLPIVFDGDQVGLPKNGTPSTHILKPAIRAVEDSVINEGYCLALADALNLSPVRSNIHCVLGQKFLLVARYDRNEGASGADDGQLRVHQEDFCQALGVVPEMKYQNEGGPNLQACFELVRRLTSPNAPQILRLFDYVIFNALIGNHDAHAKNFSLLYSGATPVLAPLYDALSTAVYPTLTPKMAMKIGSKYKFSEVHARHWEQLAESAGLSRAQAKKRIVALAELLPVKARSLQSDEKAGFSESALIERINILIEQRCALTVRRLTTPLL